MFLRQSTAVTLKIGPFLDSTDGVTAETALTISQADVRLSKNGGDYAQKNDATSCTHDELGEYNCPINATDSGTLGRLRLMVQESGALPVWHDYMVVTANVWDSLFSTDKLQVHAAEISAGLITAAAIATGAVDADAIAAAAITSAKFGAGAIDASAIADGAIDAAALAADTITAAAIATDAIGSDELAASGVQEIADQVWDEAKAGHVAAGSFGEEVQAHALSSEVAALNNLSAAEVNAEVDTGLADYDGPTKAELDAGLAALNDPTAAVIADQVWDEAKSGHVGAGSFGEEVQAHALSSEVAALNNLSAAEVNAEVDTGLADYDGPTKAELDAGLAALNNLSAAEVNAEVDTALADYDGPTKAELDAGLAALNDPTAAVIADQVWDEVTAGHVGAGSFGQQCKTDIDAILADTGTDGVALSASMLNSIADALLKRDWTGLTGEAARSTLNALRFLRNAWGIVGATLTVRKEDDSTVAWTGAVSVDAAADPVTAIDPA